MIDYNFPFDQWLLSYDPATAPEVVDDGVAPQDPFTAQARISYVPANCGVGLFWRSAGLTYYWLARLEPADAEPPWLNIIVSGPVLLRLEYANEAMRLSSSTDQITWNYLTGIYLPEAPDQVGVVLVPDAEVPILEQASITDYRLFNEVITPDPPEGLPTQQLDVPYLASDASLAVGTFAVGDEPVVHGLLGAQFGDLEVDIGKSAIWLQFLVDDLFITDINTGQQRYWVVNWSATLPEAKHNITGRNFFVNPAEWRKDQFEAGDKAWNYGDDDWCIFIDGCECLSFDTRSLPDDFNANLFKSWIYREIERAVERGQDRAYLPLFVYLKYSDLQNVTYPAATQLHTGDDKDITQAISVPWYLPAGWMCRLIKVSALRDLDFDWSSLDTPVTTPPAGETSYLTPTIDTVTTPDPGPLPNECTFVFKVRGPSARGTVASQYTGANCSFFLDRYSNANGDILLATSPTGSTTTNPNFAASTGGITNNDELLAVTRHDNGTQVFMRTWRSTDNGATWSIVTTSGNVASQPIFDSTAPVIIGGGGGGTWNGRIYSVELRTGTNPAAGTVLWKFDASDYPGTGTAYTDPRGRSWTLTNPVAIHYEPPATEAKAQVVSYGYMHWNRLDVDPGYVEVEELNEANDDGYRMRCLLSMARPIPGIPFGGPYGKPWYHPSTDPTSFPGPWAVDTHSTLDPNLALTIEEKGHTPPHASTSGVRVPLYDTVVRLNLRDGLWYEAGVSGNIPLTWDDIQQVWIPAYAPDQWEEMGIDADLQPEPPPSNTVLRMNGAVGTYTRTSDSAYLDYTYGFTLTATLAADDWTPLTRRVIVSKWGDPGQRSYYWALNPHNFLLVTSRDGGSTVSFGLNFETAVFGDGEMVELAVSFATDPFLLVDEAIFWRYVNDGWEKLGSLTAPNDSYLPLFNSTAPIEVGSAINGTYGNFAGRFRRVSIRAGVGENTVGGTEQARMRGDLELNPSYDIYGNTWSNFGGCTYEEYP